MDYRDYVVDREFLEGYNAYQAKYATQIPERDKVLLKLIARATGGKPARLLDIGCSTGNLLMQIRRFFPALELVGGDLAESSLEVARRNPELATVEFRRVDMLAIEGQFDVIVANAVAVYFDYGQYEQALRSVAGALKPGGTYIAFEWLHEFADQDVTIVETTPSHPKGLTIHFRPQERVRSILLAAGFGSVQFEPFEIPIDLPFPGHAGDPITYTQKTPEGARLQFRGALFQPWCHLVAVKG